MKIYNIFFILGALSDACSAVLVQAAFVSKGIGLALTTAGILMVIAGAVSMLYFIKKGKLSGRSGKETIRQSLALTIGMGAGLTFGQVFWKNPETGMLTGMLLGMIISNWIPVKE